MTSRGRRPWGSLGPHGNYAEGMSVLINDSLWGYVKTPNHWEKGLSDLYWADQWLMQEYTGTYHMSVGSYLLKTLDFQI